jgi:DNA-binding transcriptional ArsR family regulator
MCRTTLRDVDHQPTGHHASVDLDARAAKSVAATLQALANPSRLRILATLQAGPATVGQLTYTLAMEQSAVSHQLRLLRDHGFVTAERDGRHMEYRLYDNHIGELIEQALSHVEHVRRGVDQRNVLAVARAD